MSYTAHPEIVELDGKWMPSASALEELIPGPGISRSIHFKPPGDPPASMPFAALACLILNPNTVGNPGGFQQLPSIVTLLPETSHPESNVACLSRLALQPVSLP